MKVFGSGPVTGDNAQNLTTAQQVQALANLGLTGLFSAWTAYTPVTSTTAGSIASTVTGRYRKIGTLVLVQVQIQITSVGLGATGLTATVPFAASAFRWTIPGEVIGGSMVRGSIAASASTMTITTYSAGSPLAVGTIVLCGLYESAS